MTAAAAEAPNDDSSEHHPPEESKASPPPPPSFAPLSPMTIRRQGAVGVMVNQNELLVVGGNDQSDVCASLEVYHAPTETWNFVPTTLPTGGRTYFGAVCVDATLYVLGGWDGLQRVRSDVLCLDLSSAATDKDLSTLTTPVEWRELPPMPTARGDFACVAYKHWVYVLGGRNDTAGELRTAERFCTRTHEWESLPDLPAPRTACAAGIVNTKVYLVGGWDTAGTRQLASTLVFDLNKQVWETEPTVADLRTERYGCSLAVLDDRYVLAIGGCDATGDDLASLEVLDTLRGTWECLGVQLSVGRSDAVVGYFPEERRLVVAGGQSHGRRVLHSVEGLVVDPTALWPPGFCLDDARRVRNRRPEEEPARDVADITDKEPAECASLPGEEASDASSSLGLGTLVPVLAASLVDLPSPGVVGILGGHNGGGDEQVVLEVLLETLRHCAFAGKNHHNVCLVEVNAEEISHPNDIWPSLARQILTEWNRQIINNSSSSSSKSRQAAGSTTRPDEPGDVLSEGLLRALAIDPDRYEQDQDELNRLAASMAERHARQRQNRRRTKFSKFALGVLRDKTIVKHLNGWGLRRLERTIEPKYASALVGTKSTTSTRPGGGGPMDPCEEPIVTTESLVRDLHDLNRWYYAVRISAVTAPGYVCAVVLFCFAMVWFVVFAQAWIALGSGILALVVPVLQIASSARSAQDTLGKIAAEVLLVREDDADEENVEVPEEDAEWNDWLQQHKALELRAWGKVGSSLTELYAPRGPEATLRARHQLTKILPEAIQHQHHPPTNLSKEARTFPHNEDIRIVLALRDLHRCPGSVEIIEALQALASAQSNSQRSLYTAVVVIDPNQLDESIHLHHNPRAFLDKNVQIPFCVPKGIDQDMVDSFVDRQIATACDATAAAETFDRAHRKKSPTSVLSDIFWFPGTEGTVAKSGLEADKSKRNTVLSDRPSVADDESLMLKEILKLFRLSSHSMKRLVDVFRLLQIVWRRDNGRFEASGNQKRAVLFLLVLASEESTRDVTATIFTWMESGALHYHRVAWGDQDAMRRTNNLADLFRREFRRQDPTLCLPSATTERVEPGTLMAYIDKYLIHYEWNSIEEWNEICSKFLLARCFSFPSLLGPGASDDTKPTPSSEENFVQVDVATAEEISGL